MYDIVNNEKLFRFYHKWRQYYYTGYQLTILIEVIWFSEVTVISHRILSWIYFTEYLVHQKTILFDLFNYNQ
jgi:hypothetical protein